MKPKIGLLLFVLVLTVLTACNESTDSEEGESDELQELKVDFKVPETVDVDETVEMKAIVTYGDEKVKDADEVDFEFWEQGNKDDSTTIESTNNEDGTYTAEISFDHDGTFEIYAHTTARDLHTMPKKTITVGDATVDEDVDEHEHIDGFEMDFTKPEDVQVDQETDLVTALKMDMEPLEKAEVRYEIWSDAVSEKHEWVDAEESIKGEYTATYTFPESETYSIVIHVKDDDDLHEHETYEVDVK